MLTNNIVLWWEYYFSSSSHFFDILQSHLTYRRDTCCLGHKYFQAVAEPRFLCCVKATKASLS